MACWSLDMSPIVGLTMAQLFCTSDRLGWSKGKQISFRWSSLSVLKNRATAPSAGELGLGPACAADATREPKRGDDAARAAVPTDFTNSRREGWPHSGP